MNYCLRVSTHHLLFVVLLIFGTISGNLLAQEGPENRPNYEGVVQQRTLEVRKVDPENVRIDGVLKEAIWDKAEFTGGFIQRFPDEGEPSEDRTRIAIVYDDKYLYIGARMWSDEEILATVTRRDQADNSERIIVSMDTFGDKRTAYTFGVTASGVRFDYFHPSDNNFDRDFSYNPVWIADAVITPEGWTAEMKIPFSQLRFTDREIQDWGININRWTPSRNEDSYWVYIPRDENGWSSRFGKMTGIEGVRPTRRIEIIPYAAGNAVLDNDVNPDNPFDERATFNPRIGGDVKMGLGPNLTLEATVNPDFGQVEADPAVVNLSAFEPFFPERRPFFIEGRQLLQGRGARYFYSRRIGANPSGSVSADFVDRPQNTTILGATKLTGRFNNGVSIGFLSSLTGREFANTYTESTDRFREVEIEPLAGYEVLRVQKEFGEFASTVGAMVTGVQRDFRRTALADDFNQQAYSSSVDWNLRFQGGKYELSGNLGMSRITGNQQRISDIQYSSARFFQRPNLDYLELDTTRTEMTGYNATLSLEKNAGRHWLWDIGVSAESPFFEINDMGIINTVDDLNVNGTVRYRENVPGRIFRDYQVGIFARSGYNYGGLNTTLFSNLFWRFTFNNFWSFRGNFFQDYRAFSDNLTRGGPIAATPQRFGGGITIGTNRSRNYFFQFQVNGSTDELGGRSLRFGPNVTLRAGGRWRFSLNPRYNYSDSRRQYITELGDGSPAMYGRRYIFSSVERSTISLQTRLNYSITPDLSFELYAEPFASSANFYDFGELAQPRDLELRRYANDPQSTISRNGDTYTVSDPYGTFEFNRSDFNFLSFRSNLVMRWEWTPGSTLFLVWSQNRSESISTDALVRPGNIFDTFSAVGLNNFAIKVTYWFPVNA